MNRSLEARLERLEDRGHDRSGLGVLQDNELEALLDALKEDDPAKRGALLAAIELCPQSEQALVEVIAELKEQHDGKH
jgi:hypothetical protein